jgi:(p)ppGpp synthase/HD superfamily hydrolase
MSPDEADALAARLHGDLRTRLGGLQIAHVRRVAQAVGNHADPRVVAAALLHDVLEHCAVATDDLAALTGDPELVRLVDVLSQRAEEPDDVYLSRCASDPLTLLIKRADLADKLVANDSTVAREVAERQRGIATRRRVLLERLAGGEA